MAIYKVHWEEILIYCSDCSLDKSTHKIKTRESNYENRVQTANEISLVLGEKGRRQTTVEKIKMASKLKIKHKTRFLEYQKTRF